MTELLLFFILALFGLLGIILFLLQKYQKNKKALLEILKQRDLFLKALYEFPLEIIIIKNKEISFLNKKALESFGINPKISELRKGFNKKGKKFEIQEISLTKDTNLLLFLDITERESLKEAYQVALSYLSHELKTPLTIAKGYLEKLKNSLEILLSPEKKEILQNTQKSFEKLEKLLKKLFSGLDYLAKEIKFSKELVNLKECLEEAIFWVSPLAEDKGVRLEKYFKNHLFCYGSAELLTQAFFNLLENAVKASPEGGIVTIKVSEFYPNQIIISITDQGPGVPSEKLPLLGMPFFKLQASDGMGLGLFITKRIIEAHNGILKFYLPPSGGFEVQVLLKI